MSNRAKRRERQTKQRAIALATNPQQVSADSTVSVIAAAPAAVPQSRLKTAASWLRQTLKRHWTCLVAAGVLSVAADLAQLSSVLPPGPDIRVQTAQVEDPFSI
jgi:hypothetical protein